MIVLVITFLLGLYVLKFFMPEQFVMAIENERLVMVGNFIDNNWWLYEILAIITSFLTYWIYLGAVLHKFVLNWKNIIAVLITIAIVHILYEFDKALSSGITIISMLILPLIFKASLREVTIVFSVHYLAQLLSTLIRGLPLFLTNVNYVTVLLMTCECYFWLLLFYFYYNYKKGGK